MVTAPITFVSDQYLPSAAYEGANYIIKHIPSVVMTVQINYDIKPTDASAATITTWCGQNATAMIRTFGNLSDCPNINNNIYIDATITIYVNDPPWYVWAHELIHGLGFNGNIVGGYPSLFDTRLWYDDVWLMNNYGNLSDAITSDQLMFVLTDNSMISVYSPISFESGSSIYHLTHGLMKHDASPDGTIDHWLVLQTLGYNVTNLDNEPALEWYSIYIDGFFVLLFGCVIQYWILWGLCEYVFQDLG